MLYITGRHDVLEMGNTAIFMEGGFPKRLRRVLISHVLQPTVLGARDFRRWQMDFFLCVSVRGVEMQTFCLLVVMTSVAWQTGNLLPPSSW